MGAMGEVNLEVDAIWVGRKKRANSDIVIL
jgi:hypothetical protein